MRALGVPDVDHLADGLSWDGDVEVDDDGVHLRVGTAATGLVYPFRLADLHDLAAELEEDE